MCQPGNIFVDQRGDFWLADFGCARPLGQLTSRTTITFLPTDVRVAAAGQLLHASRAHDWWMLAMTVTTMLSAKQVGAGATGPDSAHVIEVLQSCGTGAATLLQRLKQPTSGSATAAPPQSASVSGAAAASSTSEVSLQSAGGSAAPSSKVPVDSP